MLVFVGKQPYHTTVKYTIDYGLFGAQKEVGLTDYIKYQRLMGKDIVVAVRAGKYMQVGLLSDILVVDSDDIKMEVCFGEFQMHYPHYKVLIPRGNWTAMLEEKVSRNYEAELFERINAWIKTAIKPELDEQ